ncbi:AAA family ATPase [Rossellomorea vietnamensis]|uniref:AAA family ATPase n=1 Tax=Rossellomorea vietnamensis TaxID=218284 RepID=A0A5D4NTM5_9BACI|nr:AAA family ATPase [Rossellomorea vietnamensis]TYS16676.1 AAA family ATPase [Rossellomorea vietnamensis]
MSRKTKVIAVSGVSGSGKTTVTKCLGDRLRNSESLFFDDYIWKDSPEDLVKWVKEGADYGLWNLEPLVKDVMTLFESVDPPSFILLDYPFSYQNQGMKDWIDLSIYIDTPLDVALGRRILRDYKNGTASEIHKDITFYLEKGRRAYEEMEATIKVDADYIVGGKLPVERIVELILSKLKEGVL